MNNASLHYIIFSVFSACHGVLSSRNEMETDGELLCFEFEIGAMELYMIPQV